MFFNEEIIDKLKLMTDDEKIEFIQDNTMMTAATAKYLGVSKATIVRWHTSGKLVPDLVLDDGYRFYFKWTLDKFLKGNK